jgi:hypothetical protein
MVWLVHYFFTYFKDTIFHLNCNTCYYCSKLYCLKHYKKHTALVKRVSWEARARSSHGRGGPAAGLRGISPSPGSPSRAVGRAAAGVAVLRGGRAAGRQCCGAAVLRGRPCCRGDRAAGATVLRGWPCWGGGGGGRAAPVKQKALHSPRATATAWRGSWVNLSLVEQQSSHWPSPPSPDWGHVWQDSCRGRPRSEHYPPACRPSSCGQHQVGCPWCYALGRTRHQAALSNRYYRKFKQSQAGQIF